MPGVKIFIDTTELRRLAERVHARRKLVERAFAQGLNQGGDLVRTEVRHALQKQAGLVRYGSVVSRTRSTRAAGGELLVYRIIAKGTPTKPDEFKVRVIAGKGGGVDVRMWGVEHLFARSFQQKNKGGLRARLGPERLPIRGFDGPNLAKELMKGKSLDTFHSATARLVMPRIVSAIARVL